MSSSIRRMAYSQDFKLRVLEYYFKHGGESKFGLKSKTAQHFGMDKKTISRMLLNPDMVKKASKMLAQRHPDSSSNLRSISKTSTGAKIAPKPRPKLSSDSQSIDPGDSNYGEHISPLHSKPFENAVPVFELPEDPDFSLLKRAISSSAGGAASVARLIATGTEEVQKIILNECDLIYECKVCKNLFRSVVNILAHKRIYCQEEFKNVKSLFSKENSLRMTSESETIMVDPEPPPSSPPVVDLNKNETQIDKIASRLADRNLKKRKFEELSSSTDTGSSEFYERLLNVHRTRSQMSKHCSVYLKDISGNSSAVYQTFIPPDDDAPEKSIHELLKEMHEKKLGTTALMDSQGQIVDSRVGEPSFVDISNLNLDNPESTENASQGSCDVLSVNSAPSEGSLDAGQSEDVERYVYTCPICSITFLSVSGCVKHLAKVHRKKKHQRERLRHVIRSRAYKKSYTPEEIKAHHNRNEVKIPDPIKSEPKPRERERKRTLEKKPEIKIETTTTTRPTEPEIPKSREGARKSAKERWMCNVCKKKFLSRPATLAHIATHIVCDFEPMAVRISADFENVGNSLQSRTNCPHPSLGESSNSKNIDSEYAKIIRESFAMNKDIKKSQTHLSGVGKVQKKTATDTSSKNDMENYWKSETNDNPLSITLKKFSKDLNCPSSSSEGNVNKDKILYVGKIDCILEKPNVAPAGQWSEENRPLVNEDVNEENTNLLCKITDTSALDEREAMLKEWTPSSYRCLGEFDVTSTFPIEECNTYMNTDLRDKFKSKASENNCANIDLKTSDPTIPVSKFLKIDLKENNSINEQARYNLRQLEISSECNPSQYVLPVKKMVKFDTCCYFKGFEYSMLCSNNMAASLSNLNNIKEHQPDCVSFPDCAVTELKEEHDAVASDIVVSSHTRTLIHHQSNEEFKSEYDSFHCVPNLSFGSCNKEVNSCVTFKNNLDKKMFVSSLSTKTPTNDQVGKLAAKENNIINVDRDLKKSSSSDKVYAEASSSHILSHPMSLDEVANKNCRTLKTGCVSDIKVSPFTLPKDVLPVQKHFSESQEIAGIHSDVAVGSCVSPKKYTKVLQSDHENSIIRCCFENPLNSHIVGNIEKNKDFGEKESIPSSESSDGKHVIDTKISVDEFSDRTDASSIKNLSLVDCFEENKNISGQQSLSCRKGKTLSDLIHYEDCSGAEASSSSLPAESASKVSFLTAPFKKLKYSSDDATVVLQSVKKVPTGEDRKEGIGCGMDYPEFKERNESNISSHKVPKKSILGSLKRSKLLQMKYFQKTKFSEHDTNYRTESHTSKLQKYEPLKSTYDAKTMKRKFSLDSPSNTLSATNNYPDNPRKYNIQPERTPPGFDIAPIYSLPSTSKGPPSRTLDDKMSLSPSSERQSTLTNRSLSEPDVIDCDRDSPPLWEATPSVTINEKELMAQGMSFGDVRYGWDLL